MTARHSDDTYFKQIELSAPVHLMGWLVLWKMRRDCMPNLIRKSEKIVHHEHPCRQNLKSKEFSQYRQ
jgi:hypothetical protein